MSSKLDAAVYELLADSLERIQATIQPAYKAAADDSPEDVVFSALDDSFTEEIDRLRTLADATPSEDRD